MILNRIIRNWNTSIICLLILTFNLTLFAESSQIDSIRIKGFAWNTLTLYPVSDFVFDEAVDYSVVINHENCCDSIKQLLDKTIAFDTTPGKDYKGARLGVFLYSNNQITYKIVYDVHLRTVMINSNHYPFQLTMFKSIISHIPDEYHLEIINFIENYRLEHSPTDTTGIISEN